MLYVIARETSSLSYVIIVEHLALICNPLCSQKMHTVVLQQVSFLERFLGSSDWVSTLTMYIHVLAGWQVLCENSVNSIYQSLRI